MSYIQLTRREIWKVTEYRDSCIYNTKSLGLVWILLDEVTGQRENETWDQYMKRTGDYEKKVAREHGGDLLSSVSTSVKDFNEHFKSVKEEEVAKWLSQ